MCKFSTDRHSDKYHDYENPALVPNFLQVMMNSDHQRRGNTIPLEIGQYTPSHNDQHAMGSGSARVGGNQRVHTYPTGERKRTQEEQNKVDDGKRRQAKKELIGSWMERLQLISVITTFFASAEAVLLDITTKDIAQQTRTEEATNAAFLGALVLHVFAAIVSFLGAFFLVNYRVHEAKKEEAKAEGEVVIETPVNIFDAAAGPEIHTTNIFGANPIAVEKAGGALIWSSNPELVQVGPFHGQPPADVLGRCHSLSVLLASLGFVLAMVGIGCFAWGRHARSASIFCTVWIAICVVLGVGILIVPDIKLGERRVGRTATAAPSKKAPV
ncbi:hypothetical protein AX15_007043 [Amanita polypyramis BW_CC]|nr:hypothetical protein AX15_007043 [Amanita polypyramis BW_CC]